MGMLWQARKDKRPEDVVDEWVSGTGGFRSGTPICERHAEEPDALHPMPLHKHDSRNDPRPFPAHCIVVRKHHRVAEVA